MVNGSELLAKVLILEYVDEVLTEGRVREVDVTNGKASFGSKDHIQDLESRISSLIPWRDKQKKGSEARANYSRIINRLKGELASARRSLIKKGEKR